MPLLLQQLQTHPVVLKWWRWCYSVISFFLYVLTYRSSKKQTADRNVSARYRAPFGLGPGVAKQQKKNNKKNSPLRTASWDMKFTMTKVSCVCPFFQFPLAFLSYSHDSRRTWRERREMKWFGRKKRKRKRRRRTAGFLLSELKPSHASGQSSEMRIWMKRKRGGQKGKKFEENDNCTEIREQNDERWGDKRGTSCRLSQKLVSETCECLWMCLWQNVCLTLCVS